LAALVCLLLGASISGVRADDATTSLALATAKTDSALLQLSMAQTQAQQVQDRIDGHIARLQSQSSSAGLSQSDQTELQLQMTQLQQEWSIVSDALQALNSEYLTISSSVTSNSADVASGASGASFDFNQMLADLQRYESQTDQAMQQLQDAGSSGSVNLATMFQLQSRMQVMSQYIESVSNTLSAIHNEMITMARATRGQ
jgi:chromosome segregation ATPase